MTDRLPPLNTPWGMADHSKKIADGIYFVSTPSHGGYWLSPENAAKVPAPLALWSDSWARSKSRYPAEWHEEDVCAATVVVAFPEHFTPEQVQHAWAMVKRYGPEDYNAQT